MGTPHPATTDSPIVGDPTAFRRCASIVALSLPLTACFSSATASTASHSSPILRFLELSHRPPAISFSDRLRSAGRLRLTLLYGLCPNTPHDLFPPRTVEDCPSFSLLVWWFSKKA
ncbi:hypothetical protein DFH08DRAFT_972555 [Mycena albidolilacea]|uniref:Uncharacterized protein n=1 Tax=Mycena albidolilacea TaxID=1033008 RepID=A0AAD7EEP8_9AGAR|nr:hypothetical protein DFH08DRAFT_972555 [Mycena albidolilacea]